MTNPPNKTHRAFTLVEVLLASVIFVVLMVIGGAAFSHISSWKKRNTSTNDLQIVARHALEIIAQDVEQADLNEVDPATGNYGFVIDPGGTWLQILNSGNRYERSLANRVQKSGVELTPSNVVVTELRFEGFAKTTTNYASFSYQQPYVTVGLTLETQAMDPATGQPRLETASFKTTAKPQAFDNMESFELQSGTHPNNDGPAVIFSVPFFSKPTVVISRDYWGQDSEMWEVDNIFDQNNGFSYSGDNYNTSGYHAFWIAARGKWKNVIQTGFHPNGSIKENTVTFPEPFTGGTTPIVVGARNFFGGGIELFRINQVTPTGFHYYGDQTDLQTNSSCKDPYGGTLCGVYWIAVNDTEINIGENISLQSGKAELAEEGYYQTFPSMCPWGTCEFEDTIDFLSNFPDTPNVVISRDWFDGENEIAKVFNVNNSGFDYFFQQDWDFVEQGKNISWVASSGNFKLFWSYK